MARAKTTPKAKTRGATMIRESIRCGWNKARSLVWTFLPVVLLSLVVNCVPSWNKGANGAWTLHFWWFDMGPQKAWVAVALTILNITGWIVSVWIATGVIDCSVKVARGESVTARDFFGMWRSVWRYIVSSLLCGLIAFVVGCLMAIPVLILGSSIIYIGSSLLFRAIVVVLTIILTVLLCVSIVLFELRYFMFGYYVVTQQAGPVEALRMSVEATAGHKRELFGFVLASAGIEILGTLCLGIGLLWAIPAISIAQGVVFLKLSGQGTGPDDQDLTRVEESWQRAITD